jgi:hypothetical protein
MADLLTGGRTGADGREADRAELAPTEADGTASDSTEADLTESDAPEAHLTESDGTESGLTESDGTTSDGPGGGDSASSGSAEGCRRDLRRPAACRRGPASSVLETAAAAASVSAPGVPTAISSSLAARAGDSCTTVGVRRTKPGTRMQAQIATIAR